MMTESVLAGPNFSVISCLCLWTARWSSLVNLYKDEQMDYETNLTRKRERSISRPQGRDIFQKEEEGVALTRFVFRNVGQRGLIMIIFYQAHALLKVWEV